MIAIAKQVGRSRPLHGNVLYRLPNLLLFAGGIATQHRSRQPSSRRSYGYRYDVRLLLPTRKLADDAYISLYCDYHTHNISAHLTAPISSNVTKYRQNIEERYAVACKRNSPTQRKKLARWWWALGWQQSSERSVIICLSCLSQGRPQTPSRARRKVNQNGLPPATTGGRLLKDILTILARPGGRRYAYIIRHMYDVHHTPTPNRRSRRMGIFLCICICIFCALCGVVRKPSQGAKQTLVQEQGGEKEPCQDTLHTL